MQLFPRATSCLPCGALCQKGQASKGGNAGPPRPHTAPAAGGQPTTTACPKDGQPREGECLTTNTPRNGRSGPQPRDVFLPTAQRATLACESTLYGVSVVCLYFGRTLKPSFLFLHLKAKLFSMCFSIEIHLGKDKAHATARRQRSGQTLSRTNWLVQ